MANFIWFLIAAATLNAQTYTIRMIVGHRAPVNTPRRRQCWCSAANN